MSSRTKLKSLSKKNHFISKVERKKNVNMHVSKTKGKDIDKIKQYHINHYQEYVTNYLKGTWNPLKGTRYPLKGTWHPLKKFQNGEYEIYDFIDRGKFGSVFLICNKYTGNDCKALKITIIKNNNDKKFIKEVEMQKLFYNHGLSLDVLNSELIRLDKDYSLGIIVMDLIDGTIYDFLKKRRSPFVLNRIIEWFQVILKKMCKYNLIHGDLHMNNIGYIISNEGKMKPVLLDFGWSSRGKCKPMLEILQFTRLLDKSGGIDSYNRYYLFEILIRLIQSRYKYIKGMDDVDELWDELSDDYAYEEYYRYISS